MTERCKRWVCEPGVTGHTCLQPMPCPIHCLPCREEDEKDILRGLVRLSPSRGAGEHEKAVQKLMNDLRTHSGEEDVEFDPFHGV